MSLENYSSQENVHISNYSTYKRLNNVWGIEEFHYWWFVNTLSASWKQCNQQGYKALESENPVLMGLEDSVVIIRRICNISYSFMSKWGSKNILRNFVISINFCFEFAQFNTDAWQDLVFKNWFVKVLNSGRY